MIFLLKFLGQVTMALCSGPRARPVGVGDLEALSKEGFQVDASWTWVRVLSAWQGQRESCSEKNTVGELPGGKGNKSK